MECGKGRVRLTERPGERYLWYSLRTLWSLDGTDSQRDSMHVPQWVQKEIKMLPVEFAGQIVMVGWAGGVSRG